MRSYKKIPEYTGIKFRCKNGEQRDFNVGAAADYPLMRIEEMYLIEAEALAMSQGLSTGKQALENFITTYRYKPNTTPYVSSSTTLRVVSRRSHKNKNV